MIFEYKLQNETTANTQELPEDACKKLDELLLTNENFEDIIQVEPIEENSNESNSKSNHNLYLCQDVSCQRIIKTLILQKFDHLMSLTSIGKVL